MRLPSLREEGEVREQVNRGLKDIERVITAKILCFVFAEYLLWTTGCFWPNTSPASPAFWCDMLLTLAILGLLPATRKAVEA